jgi:nitroreductase
MHSADYTNAAHVAAAGQSAAFNAPAGGTMDIKGLVQQATLAPSGHNTQPWQFVADGSVVRIHPDLSRRLPVVDPDDHALYISLGCALENLVVAASAIRLSTQVRYGPEFFEVELAPNGHDDQSALADAIPQRQSNRQLYDGRRIPDDHVRRLLAANEFDGVEVVAVQASDPAIEPIITLVKEANHLQFADERFVSELIEWIRFSRKEAERTHDGLTAAGLGFPAIPRWLGTLIIKKVVTPDGEARKCEKAIRSSSLVLVFIARKNDRRHWVDLGRAFERVALTAASLGISHAHLNMPCEVLSVREKLAEHLGLQHGEQPLLLIRLGYAGGLPHAPRRPLEEVFQTRATGRETNSPR